MRIQLGVDYDSEYFFSPVYLLDSRLLAMEMVGRFHSVRGQLSMPQALMLGLLTRQQKLMLLREQLSLLQDNAAWFSQHRVMVLLKLDHTLADFLINDALLAQAFRALSFLQIEVNEHFQDISAGRDNVRLKKLSQSFHLWLDNFGSGHINMKPFYDGMIASVKIEASFINKLLARPASVSIINPMLQVMKKHCPSLLIVAKGIDDMDAFEKIHELNVDAVQGQLWPPLSPDALDNALMPVACYG
ncbi:MULTISPECIES: EAL domain-containing protein [Dickeya]|uniref:EAL domain-containing protein n=1 Tax=Dickeya aquatica TaxID=1401087 RepID=A0A375AC27_9GAMM|nr:MULTISPECIES: EAL domain-containing protein [Dickeya]SLM63652.1 FIG00638687: hypothetical protein [Dickeya aquatica]